MTECPMCGRETVLLARAAEAIDVEAVDLDSLDYCLDDTGTLDKLHVHVEGGDRHD